MKLLNILLFLSLAGATVTDIDGNVYETVWIGEQHWMSENLKVTRFRNGERIFKGFINNSLKDTYGFTYNWHQVDDSRGICPEDWHVPSDEEFIFLEMYIGIPEIELMGTFFRGSQGSKLAGNAELWDDGALKNDDRFGSTGFNAIPLPYNGGWSCFWTSSGIPGMSPIPAQAWTRGIASGGLEKSSGVMRRAYERDDGNYVRCIDDDSKPFNFKYDSKNNKFIQIKKDSALSNNKESNLSEIEVLPIIDESLFSKKESIKDIDGNLYKVVKIGEQYWMAENLKVTHYSNGDTIQTGLNNRDWYKTKLGSYSIFNNELSNVEIYGNLYNWYAVDDDRGICPEDWHIPSDDEYTILTDYLGGGAVAGGKMKETGLEHWSSPNKGAINSSGFTVLPSGYRGYTGKYYDIGIGGIFWSSSSWIHHENSAWNQLLYYNRSKIIRSHGNKGGGFSVRCLKD